MTTEILRFEYGSRAHGTGTVDSDHDFMSIVVEDPETVTGIEQLKTDHHSTAGQESRSGPDDTDTTTYPLRTFAKLAAKGNPTVLTAFFVTDFKSNDYGDLLRNRAHLFLSKEAGSRFLGYAQGQRDALTGKRNKRTNRPELVHKHGYDTKFAYHMIRLQLQGIELMQTGTLVLPLEGMNLGLLKSIREGSIVKDSVLEMSRSLDEDLKKSIGESLLPDTADYPRINKLLHKIHTEVWEANE